MVDEDILVYIGYLIYKYLKFKTLIFLFLYFMLVQHDSILNLEIAIIFKFLIFYRYCCRTCRKTSTSIY